MDPIFEEIQESRKETLALLAKARQQPFPDALLRVFTARGRLHAGGQFIENEAPRIYEGDSGPINRKVRDLRRALMDALDPALAGGDAIVAPLAKPAAAILAIVADLLDFEEREAFFDGNHTN